MDDNKVTGIQETWVDNILLWQPTWKIWASLCSLRDNQISFLLKDWCPLKKVGLTVLCSLLWSIFIVSFNYFSIYPDFISIFCPDVWAQSYLYWRSLIKGLKMRNTKKYADQRRDSKKPWEHNKIGVSQPRIRRWIIHKIFQQCFLY